LSFVFVVVLLWQGRTAEQRHVLRAAAAVVSGKFLL
jgi:hypothetical protein